MNKITKVWLVIGVSLILIGSIIFVGVMTVNKWDFSKLQTNKFETNKYDITEEFRNIHILTDTADVQIVPSDAETYMVECYEQENLLHSVSVKDNTLYIEVSDTRKWYEHIGIVCTTPKITVSVPADEYGKLCVKASTGNVIVDDCFKYESALVSVTTGDIDFLASSKGSVDLSTTTGDISIKNALAGSAKLAVTTGEIYVESITVNGDVETNVSTGDMILNGISCTNLKSNGTTGNIDLNNVIASGTYTIERTTGDVNLKECDAKELYITTSTGRVSGSLLSDKVFFAQSDTGRVDVPKTITGGRCEVTTDTGNIEFTISED